MSIASEPLLEVRELRKDFGGMTALDHVSFDVGPGEIVGLLGQNGSGKTTAVNLISGFLRPTAGEVWFRGARIDGEHVSRIVAGGVVRTFQQAVTFTNLSVVDNLMATGASRRAVDALTQRLGLQAYLGMPAGELPHGLQRMLGVGLAVATEPRMLLLDEPAAGLTKAEADELAAFLVSLRDEGMSIVVIEHDMSFVLPISDSVVVLDAGSVIFKGSPDDMRRDRDVIDMYLGAQGMEG